MAPPQIAWTELDAWCRHTRTDLDPWEAEAIVQLGALRAGVMAEKAAEERKQSKDTDKPKRPSRPRKK